MNGLGDNKKVLIFESGKSPLSRINENIGGSEKQYIFEGPCADFNGKNNNLRYYDKDEYIAHFDYLLPQIEDNTLAGSLDHPDDEENEEKDIFTPKMKDLSHLVQKLWYDEATNQVWIRIKLMNTQWGKNAMACADAGMPIFISSRSSGFVEKDGRVILDTIHTYDIVYRPGFQNAKLQPVMESQNNTFSAIRIYECSETNPINNKNNKSNMNGQYITVEEHGKAIQKINESIANLGKSVSRRIYEAKLESGRVDNEPIVGRRGGGSGGDGEYIITASGDGDFETMNVYHHNPDSHECTKVLSNVSNTDNTGILDFLNDNPTPNEVRTKYKEISVNEDKMYAYTGSTKVYEAEIEGHTVLGGVTKGSQYSFIWTEGDNGLLNLYLAEGGGYTLVAVIEPDIKSIVNEFVVTYQGDNMIENVQQFALMQDPTKSGPMYEEQKKKLFETVEANPEQFGEQFKNAQEAFDAIKDNKEELLKVADAMAAGGVITRKEAIDTINSVMKGMGGVMIEEACDSDMQKRIYESIGQEIAALRTENHGLTEFANISAVRINKVAEFVNCVVTMLNDINAQDDMATAALRRELDALRQNGAVMEQRINKLTDYVNFMAGIVNSAIGHTDVIGQRVGTITDFTNLVAESAQAQIDKINERLGKSSNKKGVAESLSAKIDRTIEAIKQGQSVQPTSKINENALRLGAFNEDGSLRVPAKYLKSWNSLNDQQRSHVVSVFESRNPKTGEEMSLVWDTIGLQKSTSIAANIKPVTVIKGGENGLGYSDADIDKCFSL